VEQKRGNLSATDVIHAWGRILQGYRPFLSIEITRECPLRCPGCYAYEDAHLGGGPNLRELADYKGDALIRGVLEVVEKCRPLHLSIVGGDPLVRYRELEVLLPELHRRGLRIQLVTSAFRAIPEVCKSLPHVKVVVSIDGLQPEHDVRRKPATYDRILKSIAGHRITVHCTITSQMLTRPTYLQEFLDFWTPLPEVATVWFSTFTPQKGATDVEILTPEHRAFVVNELLRLKGMYPKLDMALGTIREFSRPPQSPEECIFARTTETVSADLKTRIHPCQFGGNPDCSNCGCIASMGLAYLGHIKLAGMPLGGIFTASHAIGKAMTRVRAA
jgi:MoaA/NifB/PqqE/SkfB family radical SAM enzyme